MPQKSTFAQSTAIFPNATSAPGSVTTWRGPHGKPVVHPSFIPAKPAAHGKSRRG